MKDNSEKIIRSARSIKLKPEEKAFIRKEILSHINGKPIISKYYDSWSVVSFISIRKVTALLIIVLIFGVGTSTFAKEALPGDLLYPVKIHVNENIESILAVTEKASVEVDIKHATTRLKEAGELASKGKLTEDVNTEIKEKFAKNIDSINKQVSKIEEKGNFELAAKVSNDFEKKLEDQYQAFIEISTPDATSTIPVSNIMRSIKNERKSVSKKQNNVEKKQIENSKKIEAISKVEMTMSSSSAKLSEIKQYLDENTFSSTTQNVKAKSAKRWSDAEKLFKEGKSKLDEGRYSSAVVLFKDSERKATEAKFILDLGNRSKEPVIRDMFNDEEDDYLEKSNEENYEKKEQDSESKEIDNRNND